MSLLGAAQPRVYYFNQKEGKWLRFCWAPRLERPGLIPPSYAEVSILHTLSFLLNGSSILSNNPLHSGKHVIYGSPAERNGLQGQWMNQTNPRGEIISSAAWDSLFEMAFLLLRSLFTVTLRFQRVRQTLNCLKKLQNLEFSSVGLPPLTSFISVVSIQISCHWCRNFCDSLYKTWDRTTSGAFPSQIHLWHQAILTGHFSWKISRAVKIYLLKLFPFSHNISLNL